MTEDELLHVLAKKLKRGGREFDDLERGYILESSYAQTILDPIQGWNPHDVEYDLTALANDFRAHKRNQPVSAGEVPPRRAKRPIPSAPRPSDPDPGQSALKPEERERSELTAVALADLASRMKNVQAFREVIMGGEVLTKSQAHDFLDSSAIRYVSEEWFASLNIPIVGHKATLKKRPTSAIETETQNGQRKIVGRGEGVTLFVDPPGAEYDVFSPWLPQNSFAGPTWRLTIMIPDRRYGAPRPEKCWEGSVMGDLKWLSDRLAKRFLWSESGAAWFVLTGVPPKVPAIATSFDARNGYNFDARPPELLFQRAQITMRIDPWVSPSTVARVYQLRQQELMSKQRNGRPLTNQLRVYRFVTETARKLGERPSWRRLAQLWNADERNEPKYDERHDNMSRVFARATKSLLFPYGWGDKSEK